MSTLTFILKNLQKNIGTFRFYVIFFSTFFLYIYLTLQPLFFGKVIQELEKFYLNGEFDIDKIIAITGFWLLYSIVGSLIRYAIGQEIITRPLLIDYRENIKRYGENTLNMSMGSYLEKNIGSIYKLIDRGTENNLFFLFHFFEVYIAYSVQIITVIIVLFFIDVKMALISLSLLPIVLWLGFYFVTVTSPRQNELSKKWESIFNIIGNAMSNFMLFKTLTLKNTFTLQVKKLTDITYVEQMQLNKYWNISEIYGSSVVMFTRIFVLASGIYFISLSAISLSQLFVIFAYIDWIYFPLTTMSRELRSSVKQLTEIKRLEESLGNLEKDEKDVGKIPEEIEGNIVFQDVSFGYQKLQKNLKNISFEIKKGQKIAIVGETGAGKSTIVNLLLRFWELNSGQITLDGVNIKDYKKSSLRNYIGVVSQDNSLFNLSIEENLRFANPKATKKDIEDALRKAEAHFVFDLPQGLKTIIGERGLKLSGGEKQRISIARLFLKNPSVLILDEATSALDNTTENLIQKSLERLMKGKTSIIIAHRLSTIQHADIIYVMEKGKIVEFGNYETLLQKGGKFAHLANPDKLILG